MSGVTRVTVEVTREEIPDVDADLSYLDQDYSDVSDPAARARYIAQDRERRAAYDRGDWYMLGIRAVAKIRLHRDRYATSYTIKSPGLWGIESDSDEAYFAEVFEDERAALLADIRALGGEIEVLS